MDKVMEKLEILADSAKYDVSCSTSGVARKNVGRIGNAACAGICHSWSADGRCISLLKVLFSNRCAYDCAYCANRKSADIPRASFEPGELAALTIEFYRRNYIEGLFLSSAVEHSPDYTAERILHCLSLLRLEYGFAGYIHAKIVPGVSGELLHQIGLVADRLSVNIEQASERGLRRLAPQKAAAAIFRPMTQITNTLIEQKSLRGPGTMFKGQNLNAAPHYLHTPTLYASRQDGQNAEAGDGSIRYVAFSPLMIREAAADRKTAGFVNNAIAVAGKRYKEPFAPAGQTTQLIVGAGDETDKQIIKTSESLYRTFKMKRVYFSAYIPIRQEMLPSPGTAPPLRREHRLYQADWLLRFYGFSAGELFDGGPAYLDPELDPKTAWALRNLDRFPVEVNKASLEEILRVPGIGTVSALRIVRQRRIAPVRREDLKKMGVVLKRAQFFLTCMGKYDGGGDLHPEQIRRRLLPNGGEHQLSMFEVGDD